MLNENSIFIHSLIFVFTILTAPISSFNSRHIINKEFAPRSFPGEVNLGPARIFTFVPAFLPSTSIVIQHRSKTFDVSPTTRRVWFEPPDINFPSQKTTARIPRCIKTEPSICHPPLSRRFQFSRAQTVQFQSRPIDQRINPANEWFIGVRKKRKCHENAELKANRVRDPSLNSRDLFKGGCPPTKT